MSKQVAIIMGSRSDWETMRHASETLDGLAIGVMCLALAVAFGIGIVRLHTLGPDVARAVRFLDWSGLFWVGTLLSAGAFAARSPRPNASFAVCAALLASTTAILLAALPELRAEQLRRLALTSDASLAVLLGVARHGDLRRLYRGDTSRLEPLFRTLRSERKGLYADPRQDWIGRPFEQLFALEPESRCLGDIDPSALGSAKPGKPSLLILRQRAPSRDEYCSSSRKRSISSSWLWASWT